ncbi:MAG: LPS export ABC transporter periplasmic protein LptC [Candidatus Wallbacteria bacterium]
MKYYIKKAIYWIIDTAISIIVFLKFNRIDIKSSKYYPWIEFVLERRYFAYYVFLFFMFLWLYNVYNTAGIFSEKKAPVIELHNVTFIKKNPKGGAEWILRADKLVKDDTLKKHHFTNIKFQTDPDSDSIQLISANQATQDGNMKVMEFKGNVEAKSIYPDTSETAVKKAAASSAEIELDKPKTARGFFNIEPIVRGYDNKGFFGIDTRKNMITDNFYSESLEYHYEHKVMIAREPIKIVKPKMEITGNAMENKFKENRGKVVGNVHIKIYDDSIVINR